MPAVNITTTAAKAFEIPSGTWGYRMHNASDETIYTLDNAAVTVATGMPLAAGAERTVCFAERSRQPMSVQAIHAGSGNKSLRYEILTVQLQAASRTSPSGGAGSFGSLTGVPGDNTALAAALAAKLDKAGGTMTGALKLSAGTNAAPSVNFGDTGTGFYKYATNNIGVTCNGTMRWYWNQDGSLINNGGPLVMNNSYAVMPSLYLRTNGLCLLLGASDDVRIERAAAASLQLGSNHATTATAQTIKAHNVTTGSGANLTLCGGTGSIAGGSVALAASATTGPPNIVVEVKPNATLAFFGTGGSPKVGTSGSADSASIGSGGLLTEDTTYAGYTLGQIVAGLRAYGLFD